MSGEQQSHRPGGHPKLRLFVRPEPVEASLVDELSIEEVRFLIDTVDEQRRRINEGLPLARGSEAMDANQQPVDPISLDAVSFCIGGAFLALCNPQPPVYRQWIRLCREVVQDLSGDPTADVFTFNDDASTDRAALVRLLDVALSRLRFRLGRAAC